MNLLLESAIKISLVIAPALVAVSLLRRQSAALRHWILATATLAALATPLLTLLGPSWRLPVALDETAVEGPGRAVRGTDPMNVPGIETTVVVSGSARTERSDSIDLGTLVLTTWASGAAISLAGLLVGLRRLRGITARAREISDGPWPAHARRLEGLYGLRKPVRLFHSDRPALLVTWGFFCPKIMLPVDASSWSGERIHVVLAHELAHVTRGDWIVQIAGELLRTAFWFHPLVWLSSARLRLESERACDDAVVNLGVHGRDYAEHLLALAREFGASRQPAIPAVAIAPRPSGLQQRVAAMLNSRLSRRPLSRFARVGSFIAALGAAIPIALFAQNTFATVSGTIVDELNGLLPGVSVVAIDTQRGARHEVLTGRNGRFELLGLPQGSYTLRAELPGFESHQQTLTLNGQDVTRDITMNVGSLQETIFVGSPQTGTSDNGSPRVISLRGGRRGVPNCSAPTAGAIGGQIRQPRKLHHVSPVYPTGSQPGIVRLQAVIGTDGYVKDVKLSGEAPPELVRSAIDAVRQWEFDETLLNCVPIEVRMSVFLEFR